MSGFLDESDIFSLLTTPEVPYSEPDGPQIFYNQEEAGASNLNRNTFVEEDSDLSDGEVIESNHETRIEFGLSNDSDNSSEEENLEEGEVQVRNSETYFYGKNRYSLSGLRIPLHQVVPAEKIFSTYLKLQDLRKLIDPNCR
ncbi:hypothetical protein J6590_060386 [Homalodisca vitripennis]|nr:hypothetical protein J6590_060386 [Homalodisca vitripennis]